MHKPRDCSGLAAQSYGLYEMEIWMDEYSWSSCGSVGAPEGKLTQQFVTRHELETCRNVTKCSENAQVSIFQEKERASNQDILNRGDRRHSESRCVCMWTLKGDYLRNVKPLSRHQRPSPAQVCLCAR